MGTCYTYLLYDDWDWGYNWDKSKDDVIEDIKKEFPVATVLAQWRNYIVVDMDKNSPWKDHTHELKKFCAHAWYYGDTASWDLKEMQFKPTPTDIEKEAQQPANRNKAHIDAAFEQWKGKNKIEV
jgi:hypothetical protein